MQLASILGGFSASRGSLGRSWRPLGPSWRALRPSWRHLGPSWRRLGVSWRRLGASWRPLGPPKSTGRAGPGSSGGHAAAPPKDFFGCYVYITLVYPGEKEFIKKDKRRKGRLGYRTLYAMRRHKAWRGGSNAQQSCVPATALGVWLFATRLGTESIDFWCSRDKKN